jgi:Na+/alanine symporter
MKFWSVEETKVVVVGTIGFVSGLQKVSELAALLIPILSAIYLLVKLIVFIKSQFKDK